MATVEVQDPPPPAKLYVLSLAEAEARAVYTLVGTVVGRGAFRAATDAVYLALDGLLSESGDTGLEDTVEVNEAMNAYVAGKE